MTGRCRQHGGFASGASIGLDQRHYYSSGPVEKESEAFDEWFLALSEVQLT